MPNFSSSRIKRFTRRARPCLLIAAMVVIVSACTTSEVSQQVAPYQPNVPSTVRSPWAWVAKLETTAKVPTEPAAQPAKHGPQTPKVSVSGAEQNGPAADGVNRRVLKPGDAVAITLLTASEQKTYQEEIDDDGHVVVRYLGDMELAGLTTSQAEALIEKGLIDEGYFRSVEVIVLAQQVTYFIRGEVNAPGEYELTRAKSLMQAISEAGGYTVFADEKKIYISRNNTKLDFNGKKISKQEAEDPRIQGGDIIVVERTIW